jgi:hypothetical protein
MKLGIAVMTVGIVLSVGSRVWATDLVNQDNKAYTVTIVEGSVTSTKKIAANGTMYGLCGANQCTFKIPGATIVASKNDRVVISKGKFSK